MYHIFRPELIRVINLKECAHSGHKWLINRRNEERYASGTISWHVAKYILYNIFELFIFKSIVGTVLVFPFELSSMSAPQPFEDSTPKFSDFSYAFCICGVKQDMVLDR